VARRLYRKQEVDGVYRLDEGAVLDDFFHFLQAIGVMTLLEKAHGAAIQREMRPFVQYVLLYGLKTLFGMESINALPSLLFSDEALMPLVGFNASRSARHLPARREQAPGGAGPRAMCPDTLAKNIVKWHWRDLEAVFNGAIRALAKRASWGQGHGHCRWHGSGDHRALSRLWPGDPQSPDGRQARAEARH